ncbi:copper chaperone PCu(A)C [Acetobacter indonesiensis]
MKIRLRSGILSLALGAILTCGSVWAEDRDPGTSIPGQSDAQKDIQITDTSMGLVRNAGRISVVYFTLRNNGENAHLVTSVSSPSCRTLVGHHSDQESTEGTLNLFTHLSLPAKTTLVFPHGGYHLLCLDTDSNLAPGKAATFTFSFLGGSSKTVSIPMGNSQPVE